MGHFRKSHGNVMFYVSESHLCHLQWSHWQKLHKNLSEETNFYLCTLFVSHVCSDPLKSIVDFAQSFDCVRRLWITICSATWQNLGCGVRTWRMKLLQMEAQSRYVGIMWCLWPVGLWDVEDPTFYRQLAHRWRQGCQPYAPAALYSAETLFFCFWYSFLLEAE
jgi:hypothetical protein